MQRGDLVRALAARDPRRYGATGRNRRLLELAGGAGASRGKPDRDLGTGNRSYEKLVLRQESKIAGSHGMDSETNASRDTCLAVR